MSSPGGFRKGVTFTEVSPRDPMLIDSALQRAADRCPLLQQHPVWSTQFQRFQQVRLDGRGSDDPDDSGLTRPSLRLQVAKSESPFIESIADHRGLVPAAAVAAVTPTRSLERALRPGTCH